MTGGSAAAPQQTEEAQQPTYQQQPYQQQQSLSGPCSYEIQEFLDCAQNQSDITLCEGFKNVMQQCKMNQGL